MLTKIETIEDVELFAKTNSFHYHPNHKFSVIL